MRTSYTTNPTSHEQACRMLEALCEGYVRAMMEEFDAYPEGEFPCCIKCAGFRTRNAPLTPCQVESIEETLEHGHPVSGLQRHCLADVLADHGAKRNADLLSTEPVDYGRGSSFRPTVLAAAIEPDAAGATYDPFDNPCGEDEDCPAQNFCGASGQCEPVLSGPYGRPEPPSPQRRGQPGNFGTLAVGAHRRGGSVRVRSARDLLRNQGGHTVELACYQCAMKRRLGADPGAKVIICCVVPGTFRGAVLMSDQHKKEEKRGRIDDPVVDARPIGACACVLPPKEGT